VSTETAVQIAFAAGVVLVAAAIATALWGRGSRRELAAIAGLLGLGAAAGWAVFALDVDRGTAVAAGGLTVCFAAALLTLPLRAGLARHRRIDAELEEAETALRKLVERETVQRGEELERTLARARAETSSRLAEDERKLAEARRSELAQRERRLSGELGEALALVERRVEQRLTEWSGDLDRIQQGLTTRLAELAQRQREAVSEAQSRLETEMEQLKSASEDQRTILAKLREEFERAAGEAGTAARREVEVHESERRRALHEVSERLRQRERELRERIAAEETDAVRRIQSGFADVERHQIDQLTRIVDRTANRLSEAAVEQFSATVKAARDDAAKRLSRELDRAVAQFAHDAQSVLAERLAQVSDAGAARVDRKLSEIVGRIEQRRDEFLADFQRRFTDVEAELRSQIRAVGADAEAEREVLEARVHDLTRRLETAVTAAESSLEGAFRTP
jgi:gas vesicle protein